MIRTEAEYEASKARAKQQADVLKQQSTELSRQGLSAAQIKRAIDPLRTFAKQLEEEIQSYEQLRRGEFAELTNLQGIGQLLIGLRIALGLNQRELAERLGVHETQVSRDERNEYFGVTTERAQRIFETLGVVVTTRVEKLPKLAKSA
jgi:DNA-directed RNA polymerase specialized sigma subunit